MRREREAHEGKIRGLQLEQATRVNDAARNLSERYTVGMQVNPDMVGPPQLPGADGKSPDFREATKRELLAARRGLFAAQGNVEGLRTADADERGLNIGDRFQALASRTAQDPEAVVELSRRLNLDGNVPLTVETPTDPKTGRLTGVARINLVKADGDTKPIVVQGRQLQQLMLATAYIEEGTPEDVEKGLQLLAGIDGELAARVAQANRLNLDLAQLHNSAYGTQAQVRQGEERLGLARSEERRQAAAEWQIIGTTQDRKGLLYFNPRTRQTETRPLPAGVDAAQLTRRLGLANPDFTPQQLAEFRLKLVQSGISDPMELDRVMASITGAQDPMDALTQNLMRLNKEATQAGGAAAAQEQRRVAQMRDEEMAKYRAGLGPSVDWYSPQ